MRLALPANTQGVRPRGTRTDVSRTKACEIRVTNRVARKLPPCQVFDCAEIYCWGSGPLPVVPAKYLRTLLMYSTYRYFGAHGRDYARDGRALAHRPSSSGISEERLLIFLLFVPSVRLAGRSTIKPPKNSSAVPRPVPPPLAFGPISRSRPTPYL